MKAKFPIDNTITDLDISSPLLDQSRPVTRFVLGSIALHILSASSIYMLRPLPQPPQEVVEIHLGAGPQATLESAPVQSEALQEAAPVVAPPAPVVVAQTTPVVPVTKKVEAAKPEPVAEPIAEKVELETPTLDESPVKIAAPVEVTSEAITDTVEQQPEPEQLEKVEEKIEEKLATTEEAPLEPVVEAVAAVAEPSQGEAVQTSSPAPLQGELRTLAQLRQMPGNPKPYYDPIERKMGHSGAVVFKAFVTQDGRLSNFQMIQSTGHKNLDFKTLKALKQWKFYPGQEGWVELPFKWDLKGGPQEMPTQLRRGRVGQNSN